MPDTLPVWSLEDLFPEDTKGLLHPLLEEALQSLEKEAEAFSGRFKGTLSSLEGEGFLEALRTYESLDQNLSRVLSYAHLRHAVDVSGTTKLYQTVMARATQLAAPLLFFSLELAHISEETITTWLGTSKGLLHYEPWIRATRATRPHQLDETSERLLLEKSAPAHQGWVLLFDELMTSLRFEVDGKNLTEAETLDLLTHPEPHKRKEAALALGTTLKENAFLLARITNTLAKNKEIEDRWRHFKNPVSSRNLSNLVEDEVVSCLVRTVRDAYPETSHRFYRIKARLFGQERLMSWDRVAPLPGEKTTLIPWQDARSLVLESYQSFSPVLGDIASRFFEHPWIDAAPRPGKVSGAFSAPTVPDHHPYILLNYKGKPRDVMTLAHEVGHGIHQSLAAEQGHLLADTPLTLAETASVFGEMLTFRRLLESTSKEEKVFLLGRKIEDMLATVTRQISFFVFEERLHGARQELSVEDINTLWMDSARESLGDAIEFHPLFSYSWAYIPHFVHNAFYVYAYAFGELLVNSLYQKYTESPVGFAECYVDLLKSGGRLRHHELVAPFSLDTREPSFWKKGLSMIVGLIDEFETLVES